MARRAKDNSDVAAWRRANSGSGSPAPVSDQGSDGGVSGEVLDNGYSQGAGVLDTDFISALRLIRDRLRDFSQNSFQLTGRDIQHPISQGFKPVAGDSFGRLRVTFIRNQISVGG